MFQIFYMCMTFIWKNVSSECGYPAPVFKAELGFPATAPPMILGTPPR